MDLTVAGVRRQEHQLILMFVSRLFVGQIHVALLAQDHYSMVEIRAILLDGRFLGLSYTHHDSALSLAVQTFCVLVLTTQQILHSPESLQSVGELPATLLYKTQRLTSLNAGWVPPST
jgi:hypothetical protein